MDAAVTKYNDVFIFLIYVFFYSLGKKIMSLTKWCDDPEKKWNDGVIK